MCSPEECWTLEREPSHLEPSPWFIRTELNVRHDLKIVRIGNPEDWRTVRWSVLDLGGLNGTFLNRRRIEANVPYPLNCNDLLGIGCPDERSTENTFVYR